MSFGAQLKNFSSGPSAHIASVTQQPQIVSIVVAFIFLSLFKFIWSIVVLCSVGGAIVLINIGGIFHSFYAINGHPEGFGSLWFGGWLIVDFIFLGITFFRAHSWWMDAWEYVALAVWLALWIAEVFLFIGLRRKLGLTFSNPAKQATSAPAAATTV